MKLGKKHSKGYEFNEKMIDFLSETTDIVNYLGGVNPDFPKVPQKEKLQEFFQSVQKGLDELQELSKAL